MSQGSAVTSGNGNTCALAHRNVERLSIKENEERKEKRQLNPHTNTKERSQ
jgi:hypothetical protein